MDCLLCELYLNEAVIKDEHKRSLEQEKEARGGGMGMALSLLDGCEPQAMIWGTRLLPVALGRKPCISEAMADQA